VRGSAPVEGSDGSHAAPTGEPGTTSGPSLRVLRTEQPANDEAAPPGTASDVELLERRRYLVGLREQALNDRVTELDRRETNLDEREAALSLREAEHQMATSLETESLAVREQELDELANRLERKEAQVADYVVQAQRQLARAATPEPEAQPSRRGWRRHR
jgi:hypothetical protein